MENNKLSILINILLSSLAVYATAYILPGVHISSFLTAIVVAIVLGIINANRTFIFLITLPINILTLGLFTFVIIGGISVQFVSAIVPGFKVDSFWWGLGFVLYRLLSIPSFQFLNEYNRFLRITPFRALALARARLTLFCFFWSTGKGMGTVLEGNHGLDTDR